MSTSWKLSTLTLLVCLAMGCPRYADAQTLPLQEINNLANKTVGSGTSTDTFNVDGLQFTVSSCSYTLNGTAQSSCSGANIEVAFDGSHRGSPTIEFLSNNNSSAALSGTPTSGKLTAVSFMLTVAPVAFGNTGYKAGTVVSAISNAVTGAGTPANVFANVSCATSAVCGTDTANSTLSQTNSSFASFAATSSSVSLNINLGLTGNGTTLTLANDALHFSPAPEPTTIALFATGLTGLAAIRRRFKRHDRTAS